MKKQQSAISSQHSVITSGSLAALVMTKMIRSRGLRNVFSTVLAALREIFDENAYARFLVRHEMANSREAYALYLRESNVTRERRPRCC